MEENNFIKKEIQKQIKNIKKLRKIKYKYSNFAAEKLNKKEILKIKEEKNSLNSAKNFRKKKINLINSDKNSKDLYNITPFNKINFRKIKEKFKNKNRKIQRKRNSKINKEIFNDEEKEISYKSPNLISVKIRQTNKIDSDSLLRVSRILERKNLKENLNEKFLFEKNKENSINTIYDLDFFNNLLEKEKTQQKAEVDYIENHPSLNIEHRAILVDWMIALSEEMAFTRDTLYFAVNYLDRFLSKRENIEKNILQVIGLCCLSISAKFQVNI